MALRFMDSFEVNTNPYTKWTGFIESVGDGVIGTGTTGGFTGGARTGTGFLAAANDGIFKTIDFQSTWIIGAAYWFESLENSGGIILRNNGQVAAEMLMGADGLWRVIPGNGGGTTTGTAAMPLNAGAWYYTEWFCTLGTAGSAIVRINGQVVLNLTINLGTITTADMINVSGAAGGNAMGVDDFYVFDTNGTNSFGQITTNTNFAGDIRIGTITASADTATIQWLTSTGTAHFSLINQQPPPGDGSYVQSTMTGTSTTGPTDLYKFSTIGTNSVVVAAQSNIFARKTDAASRAVVCVTSNAQGSSTGTQFYLNMNNYLDYLDQYDVNPNGGGTWTPQVINTTTWGVQVVI